MSNNPGKHKSFRKNHPIIFCILAVFVCWLVSLVGASIVYTLFFENRFADERLASGVGTVFCDGVLAACALLILWRTGRASLVTKKGSGFGRGLLVAAAPLTFSVVVLVASLVSILFGSEQAELEALGYTVNFDVASVVIIIGYLVVGLAEELMCRGIVAQTLLEHFGTERAGIWKAAVVSGLVFCLLHSSNFLLGSPVYVCMQMIGAFGSGILYAVIYYRTGNIWVTVLAHGLNDVMAGIVVWLCSYTEIEAMSGADSVSLLPAVVFVAYLLLSCFLLRRKKIGQVKENWPELDEWRAVEEPATPAAAA